MGQFVFMSVIRQSENEFKIEGLPAIRAFSTGARAESICTTTAPRRAIGKQRNHVLPVVFQGEPDVIASLHAKHPEMARCTQNQFREFAIGDGSVFVDKGDRGRLYPPVPENRLNDVHGGLQHG